jgi:hypothetical protein
VLVAIRNPIFNVDQENCCWQFAIFHSPRRIRRWFCCVIPGWFWLQVILLMQKSLAVGFSGYQQLKVSHDGAISGNIEGEAVMIITAF